MFSPSQHHAWDLTPVIDLINSLSSQVDKYTASDTSSHQSSAGPITPVHDDPRDGIPAQLGNFDKIWEFLGQPSDLPAPAVTPEAHSLSFETRSDETDAIDLGPNLTNPKGVRWRDEVAGADLADNDEDYDSKSIQKLSKAKKKKLRMKKRNEAVKAWTAQALPPSSSENESEQEVQQSSPAHSRQSVIRTLLFENSPVGHETVVNPAVTSKAIHPDIVPNKRPVANPRYFLRSSVRKPESTLTEASDRKLKLIMKLREHFIDDRPYLENIGLVTLGATESVTPNIGLHVFVDASNASSFYYNAGLRPRLTS